jgi:hypothetical protein
MAQLRSDILRKKKHEEAKTAEKQYKRIYIAEPIQQYETSDEEKQDENEPTVDNEEVRIILLLCDSIHIIIYINLY